MIITALIMLPKYGKQHSAQLRAQISRADWVLPGRARSPSIHSYHAG